MVAGVSQERTCLVPVGLNRKDVFRINDSNCERLKKQHPLLQTPRDSENICAYR
jgi:hypothetical protein